MGRTFDINRSASKPPTESSSLTHPLQLRMDDRGNGVNVLAKEKKRLSTFQRVRTGFVVHQPPI